MLICSCNIISADEIKSVIIDLLNEDPWQLIVPLQVYHRMGKRGRCCGCFPNLVGLIVDTSRAYHENLNTDQAKVVQFVDRLKRRYEQCETARLLARKRILKTKAA